MLLIYYSHSSARNCPCNIAIMIKQEIVFLNEYSAKEHYYNNCIITKVFLSPGVRIESRMHATAMDLSWKITTFKASYFIV